MSAWKTNRKTRKVFPVWSDIQAEGRASIVASGRPTEKQRRKAREFLGERAVDAVFRGSEYLRKTSANGFTILHDDSTGTIFDIDRDLVEIHNALPREQLFIIAKDNNRQLSEAISTSKTTPWEIVQEYGPSPGYRVTTTGGWMDKDGNYFIDHGLLIATTLSEALEIGRRWNQQSVLELDNRGDALKVEFHNVA